MRASRRACCSPTRVRPGSSSGRASRSAEAASAVARSPGRVARSTMWLSRQSAVSGAQRLARELEHALARAALRAAELREQTERELLVARTAAGGQRGERAHRRA
jgi:hypothetical protein